MIVMDSPLTWVKFGRCSHLMSTKPGPEGTKELLEFGERIGLKKEWLQKAGTYQEHFDIFASKLKAAQKAGAVSLDRYTFVDHLKKRREAMA